MNQETATSDGQYQYFSEYLSHEDGLEFLSEIPDTLLDGFSEELDQAEADRIWSAAEQLGMVLRDGPPCLFLRG